MRNLIVILFLALSFASCEKQDALPPVGGITPDATILGRWIPEGFPNVLYEFTETQRFTIYGTGDGDFPTLEEFMEENPGLTGNTWEYDGDVVVIDLNFGNYSRLIPNFNCMNMVINWVNEEGGDHSTTYREGHDMATCGETTTEATILGRWVPEGFETNVRYDFTATKRFTIYGTGDGEFPSLEEFMEENPGLTGNDWEYDGDVVVIDLNFGNYSRLIPNFNCSDMVINWTSEDGEDHSTSYREGHDIATCS